MSKQIKKEKVRKVYLNELPKYTEGRYKGKINWKESVGYKLKFIYEGIEGELEIVKYEKTKYIK